MAERRVGVNWNQPVPKIGELRHPVSLVRAHSVPDAGAGMNLTLTRVWQAWAKVELVRPVRSDGDGVTAHDDVTHLLVLRRHAGLAEPEARDFLVWQARLLRILQLRTINAMAVHWIIACNDEGALASWTFDDPKTPEDPHDPENPEEEPLADPDFPMWE
jgi:hypothetical protein